MAEMESRLEGLDEEEARLWRAWRKQSPPMSEEHLERQLAEVASEREALADMVAEQKAAAAAAHADQWKLQSVERWLGQARERLGELTREEQRALLHTILDGVLVDRDGGIELRFAIPTDGGDPPGGGGSTPPGDPEPIGRLQYVGRVKGARGAMAKAPRHGATAQLTRLPAAGSRSGPAMPSRSGYASPAGHG